MNLGLMFQDISLSFVQEVGLLKQYFLWQALFYCWETLFV